MLPEYPPLEDVEKALRFANTSQQKEVKMLARAFRQERVLRKRIFSHLKKANHRIKEQYNYFMTLLSKHGINPHRPDEHKTCS